MWGTLEAVLSETLMYTVPHVLHDEAHIKNTNFMFRVYGDHEIVRLYILVNIASLVHLHQALEHLACYVRNGAFPLERRVRYVGFQGHVDELNLDVLCATHKAVTVIPDHSVTLFVIHHAQIV